MPTSFGVSFFLVRWYQTRCCHYCYTQQTFYWVVRIKKSIGVIINYNMVKYWCFCRAIYMCLSTIPYVSYVAMLLGYNWSWYQCTWTWKIVCWWSQWHLQEMYIYQLISNVWLSVSKTFDSHIIMHYCTQNNDISLAKTSKKFYLRNIVNIEALIRGDAVYRVALILLEVAP